eukprot:794593-Rhodomonas_salina.2
MGSFLAPRVHREAGTLHPSSKQADDVERWVPSFADAWPETSPLLIVLVFLDPDGERPSAIMIEQGITDVQSRDLLNPQSAQRADSHDGCITKLMQGAAGQTEDASKVGRGERGGFFARDAAKQFERLNESLHPPTRERERLALRAMSSSVVLL